VTADLVAAAMFAGVVAYALFGGADYGAGVWDLTAGRSAIADRARRQIDRSIGPVWEANHVWLIFVIVMLWTGFPRAFSAIMTTLAVPWSLTGLGIVFRGGAFVFRKSSPTYGQAQLHGIVFAASSLVTPFFLGTIAGAIAAGRVPLDGSGDPLTSWTGPLSIVGGVLAVLVTAFLAGVLLTVDSHRRGDEELSEWFRRRALLAAAVTGVAALTAAATIEATAPSLADGLHGPGAPLVVASAVGGGITVWALLRRRLAVARAGAFAAVASVVTGWGVAQYPDVLVDVATIDDVAGAPVTMRMLLAVVAVAAVTVVPALVWLLRLVDQPRWK
jgi:cytochrome d ubiquinol oxidase subunit II